MEFAVALYAILTLLSKELQIGITTLLERGELEVAWDNGNELTSKV